jgi:hypothetical protein
LSGALSPSEFALLERLVTAVERLVEVATVPVYVTTLKDKLCPECGAREGLDYHAFHCSRPGKKSNRRGRVIMDDIP